MPMRAPFVPPPYPFDRLDEIRALAAKHPEGALDLSIGTPTDPPPDTVIAALSTSGLERGYLPSVGTAEYRSAAATWLNSTVGSNVVSETNLIATVGSKELVVGLPHWLRLRRPDLDTVLYPAVSYPSYAMGAELAGCRAVPVRVNDDWTLDLASISDADAERALCLWVASPGNPTGAREDLGAIANWGRDHGVPVFSDECYVEFCWDEAPSTILEHGLDGVVAVHSLSKRSNLAGTRAGFIAGDPEIVGFLAELRQHLGLLVPGPVQAAAIAAFSDSTHVEAQRQRYLSRLHHMRDRLSALDIDAPMPHGGFYLWMDAPTGDGWELARTLATELGVVGSPGEFYGSVSEGSLRLAMVRDASGH
jgi:aspartate/methionine/tyrosine aminotransferase